MREASDNRTVTDTDSRAFLFYRTALEGKTTAINHIMSKMLNVVKATTSFLSKDELQSVGFKSIGENVLISRKASIYGAHNISIGNNVRIDDFAILSGNLIIGSHIHISAYVALYGAKGIELKDYTGVSPRSTIYSAMDDFSGSYLIGPIHPEGTTNVTGGKVVIERFVQIGCDSVVFPNITIREGSVVGAKSLVNKTLDAWGVYVGVPAKRLKDRKKDLAGFVKSSE